MLDFLPTRSNRLLNALEDIASNVEIQSNFWISYPNYPTLEVPTDLVENFRQLSPEIYHNYLSLQLRDFLYHIYFTGEQKANVGTDANSDCQDVENNTVGGLNVEFSQRLQENNCGKGYFDPGWQILREESDGTVAVRKDRLTLHIDRDRHLQLAQQFDNIGDLVAIRMPSNLMDNGCYVAVGNAGKIATSEAIDIYFNLSSQGAIALMKAITKQLNKINLPFTFKVIYEPSAYDCYDAGILNCARHNYAPVQQILEPIYKENRAYFQQSVPLFTKLLAPGLSLAESPYLLRVEAGNFGKHRCQIVADGLLAAWQTGDLSSAGRMLSIRQHFSSEGIELERPYLNPKSEDVYKFVSEDEGIDR